MWHHMIGNDNTNNGKEEPNAFFFGTVGRSQLIVTLSAGHKLGTIEECFFDIIHYPQTSLSLVERLFKHEVGRSHVERDPWWSKDTHKQCDSSEKKLFWLRSQIIGGGDAEFDSPFGKRRLTYADHTATGRCLHYIENYIIDNVLPFYGNTHTCDSYVGQRTTKMVHEASAYIKRQLGGRPRLMHSCFVAQGTTAAIKRLQEVMGIAVPSTLRDRLLKSLVTEERWVVFVGPYEHHSNLPLVADKA
ncbi:hypothetical protein L1049_019719 [Liquidambar formosana]|uniref:Uncharacterized protein n=1 Tax=Liquidambar formosana TaxID=63359 RepID=A0AAP0SCZ2_LIQFO